MAIREIEVELEHLMNPNKKKIYKFKNSSICFKIYFKIS